MKINFKKIKKAVLKLANSSEKERDMFLKCLIESIDDKREQIINANKIDIEKAKKNKLPESFVQRLELGANAIYDMQKRIRSVLKLNSGVGEIIKKHKNKNGLILQKVRVSFGVLLVIYEARPEVTIDVASLCVKSGNAVILKGGSEAKNTNNVLYSCIEKALEKSNFPKEVISLVSNRSEVEYLLTKNKEIDLVIARGGYKMVREIINKSKIPFLAHASGGARIFVDKSADLDLAQKIILNSKITKPAACNSLDTIVIHREIADRFLSQLFPLLISNSIRVFGDKNVCKIIKTNITQKEDWNTEFLGLTVSIKIVKNKEEAVEFVNRYSKKHSEGIIAKDKKIIKYFTQNVDTAALFVNCSTRFHDGYVFGFGAEMGIATGKLHVRGPVGLKELTTYKWEIYGKGNIRE